MDEETKSKLEELQAEIKLKTDKKITQQEILAQFVDYREAAIVVAQRKSELVAEVLREWGYDLNRA